jgi:hypothetical protein
MFKLYPGNEKVLKFKMPCIKGHRGVDPRREKNGHPNRSPNQSALPLHVQAIHIVRFQARSARRATYKQVTTFIVINVLATEERKHVFACRASVFGSCLESICQTPSTRLISLR